MKHRTAGSDMLDEEISFFDESLDDWLKQNAGMIALVKGKELIGVYNTEDEALVEGARRYQLQSFLIRRIVREQPSISAPALTLGILKGS
jgi:hypothetical protein